MKITEKESRIVGIKKVRSVPMDGSSHEKVELTHISFKIRAYREMSFFITDYPKAIKEDLSDLCKSIVIDTEYNEGILNVEFEDVEFKAFPKSLKIGVKKDKKHGKIWDVSLVLEMKPDPRIEDLLVEFLGKTELDENGKKQFVWGEISTENEVQ